MTNTPLKYRRILLKYSGEAFMGSQPFGIDAAALSRFAKELIELKAMGIEIGLVLGGGNIYRGKTLASVGMRRVTGDQMGMLATVMNALALRDTLESQGCKTEVMSAISMNNIVTSYNIRLANEYLEDGQIVIFAGGTGSPFFTTDTAACLRGIEINADVVIKATKVNGVYSADPITNANATLYSFLTYNEVLNKQLAVMDATAICLCQEHKIPIIVYNLFEDGALKKIVAGEHVGTKVGEENDK